MAKKFMFVNVDITFPDGMTDDEYTPEPGYPHTPAVPAQEVRKIIQAGAAQDGFDCEPFNDDKATRYGVKASLLVDLAQQ